MIAEQLKIAIVEDELIIAELIKQNLLNLGYFVYEPVITYTDAIELIKIKQPDLIIIDIILAGKKDGIDLAEAINANFHTPFIFLTSNSDLPTLDRAKQTMPYAYLVKPFKQEDLFTAIETAVFRHNNIPHITTSALEHLNFLLVKIGSAYVKVFIDEILYLKSEHVYVEVFLKNDNRHLLRMSISEIIKKLPSVFLQVHRSYIINTRFVESFSKTNVIVKGINIPVSKVYSDALFEALKK
jgi:DNA-binding LytR/AlgR family response regulator